MPAHHFRGDAMVCEHEHFASSCSLCYQRYLWNFPVGEYCSTDAMLRKRKGEGCFEVWMTCECFICPYCQSVR